MKKNLIEPQQDGSSPESSEYKLYGDYYLLDSDQGSILNFPDDDDEEPLYLPLPDFDGDQKLEE